MRFKVLVFDPLCFYGNEFFTHFDKYGNKGQKNERGKHIEYSMGIGDLSGYTSIQGKFSDDCKKYRLISPGDKESNADNKYTDNVEQCMGKGSLFGDPVCSHRRQLSRNSRTDIGSQDQCHRSINIQQSA